MSDEKLPTGPVNKIDDPTERAVAVENDFAATVAESKERLAAEPLKPVKAGRGRPKGSRKVRPGAESTESTKQSTETAAPLPGTPPPNVTEHLVLPIQAISRLPAIRFKIPELAFTREESLMAAESLNAVLEAFVPDLEKMSPKTAAILTAGLTFGSLGFTKYQIYSEVMEKRRSFENQNRVAEVESTNQPAAPATEFSGPLTSATDYFRK